MASIPLDEEILAGNPYHVLLFTTPLPFPLSLVATHPWLVTIVNGEYKRWEVWQKPRRCETSWGHVHLNLFKPWQGMRKFYFFTARRSVGKLRAVQSGGEGSLAHQMSQFIERESASYPAAHRYFFLRGPNSNTYVQWVINHFPESGFRLPLTGVGKKHRIELRPVRRGLV